MPKPSHEQTPRRIGPAATRQPPLDPKQMRRVLGLELIEQQRSGRFGRSR